MGTCLSRCCMLLVLLLRGKWSQCCTLTTRGLIHRCAGGGCAGRGCVVGEDLCVYSVCVCVERERCTGVSHMVANYPHMHSKPSPTHPHSYTPNLTPHPPTHPCCSTSNKTGMVVLEHNQQSDVPRIPWHRTGCHERFLHGCQLGAMVV